MTTWVAKPGTLVVLEGLDRTGKSTQARSLERELDHATTVHVHMPSGFTHFTQALYTTLNSGEYRPTSGLAKQLAHLACHAESVPYILKALESGAVVLDRWWWSSIAYGWFGGDVPPSGMTHETFTELVRTVWAPLTASVIFLFDKPFEEDANNSHEIAAGYRALVHDHQDVAVLVPQLDTASLTAHIIAELAHRGLVNGRD